MKSRPTQQSKTVSDRIQHAYIRFLKLRGEPREIALGFSLGIMVGMSPFLGFHTIIAVFLAAMLKWNKLAAAVAVFITNPLTAPIIYPVTLYVGKKVLGISNNFPELEGLLSLSNAIEFIKHSPMILVDLMVGGIIIGLPLSIAAYWIVLTTIENYRRRIKPKLSEKRQARKAQKAIKRDRKKNKKKRKK